MRMQVFDSRISRTSPSESAQADFVFLSARGFNRQGSGRLRIRLREEILAGGEGKRKGKGN